MSDALVLEAISKRFGGVKVLDNVGLTVRAGEVMALLGHNGSGKSTLIKVLSGYYKPEPGAKCWIAGSEVPLPMDPRRARNCGLAFVHQQPGMLPALSVTENVLLRELAIGGLSHISWRRQRDAVAGMLDRWELSIDPKERVAKLRTVEVAMLSIVRAVEGIQARGSPNFGRSGERPLESSGGGVLVLDEATAALTVSEVEEVFDMIRRVTARGVAVVFVSHDIDEVFRVAARITTLRDGQVVGTARVSEVTKDDVVEMIVGSAAGALAVAERTKVQSLAAADRRRPERPSVILEDCRSHPGSEPVTLEVGPGEVLGLTGLAGSPARDIPYLIYGAAPWVDHPSGRVHFRHRSFEVGRMTPWRSISEGVVLVPGDRLREGGISSLSVNENVRIPMLRRFFRKGALRYKMLRERVQALLNQFNVRPPDQDMQFGNLSGGNQQKVVIAKWLESSPPVVLLVDPTHGVDVGSRAEIWEVVVKMVGEGCSVVCASSDSEELAAICTRVLVLGQGGGIFAELEGDQIHKDRITELCLLSGSPAVRTEEEVAV